jgi:hypothetical protein
MAYKTDMKNRAYHETRLAKRLEPMKAHIVSTKGRVLTKLQACSFDAIVKPGDTSGNEYWVVAKADDGSELFVVRQLHGVEARYDAIRFAAWLSRMMVKLSVELPDYIISFNFDADAYSTVTDNG